MVWSPASSVAVVKVATPLPSRVPVPSTVSPSLNSTVPFGFGAPAFWALTLAVNVTLCP